MLWILFVIIATFIWAWTNILDKVLRTKYLKDSIALTASFGIFSIIFSITLLLILGIPAIPFWNFIAALIAGFILTYGIIPYVKALSIEEASRVIALWHLFPVFTLILAVIFLNETLTMLRYSAFIFILLGGFLMSTRKIGSVFHLSPAVYFMLLSSFLVAISDVLLKFAYSSQIFWHTFMVFYFGISLGSLSLFIVPSIRRKFSKAVLSYKKVFLAVLFLSILTGFMGHIFYNYAILSNPITLVSVFISFQSLFVLLIATFLSFKFPLFIKEAIDVKTIGIKLVAIALMGFGLFLLVL